MHRTALFGLLLALGMAMTSVGSHDPVRAQEATPDTACPVTTEAENEATARRWFEDAINGADLAVIDEIVAADVVHHSGTFPDGQGPDAIKGILGALLAGFPDTRHTVEHVIAKDDHVVVRWQAQGVQVGEFQGYAPTGQRVTWTGINIYRIECGKIAESWSEVDGLGRLDQLGLIATPTP